MNNLYTTAETLEKNSVSDSELAKTLNISVAEIKNIREGILYPNIKTKKLIYTYFNKDDHNNWKTILTNNFDSGMKIDNLIISEANITEVNTSNNIYVKLLQGLKLKKKETNKISFQDIDFAEISYGTRPKVSPMDIGADNFNIYLNMKNHEIITIPITNKLKDNLLEVVEFLNYKMIDVYDKQQILKLIRDNINLYNYFNKQYV